MAGPTRIHVIYDGECPLCRRAREWLAARDRHGAFVFLPCGSEAQREHAPEVGEAACREAMHVVADDGVIYAGADAVGAILPFLSAPWPLLGGVLRMPGLRALAPVGYAWVARHRLGLSAMLPGHACDVETRDCGKEKS